MAREEFTPTEKRIMQLLSDGEMHPREEVHKCLDDELSSVQATKMHMLRLRRKLKPKGRTIVTEIGHGYVRGYRLVRLIVSPTDAYDQ